MHCLWPPCWMAGHVMGYDPGVTEVAGQFGCPDCSLVCAFKMEEETDYVCQPLPSKESSSTPLTVWQSSRADSFIFQLLFKPWFCFCFCFVLIFIFFCVQRHRKSAPGPSLLSLLTVVLSIGIGGSLRYQISVSLDVPICHSHFFYCTEAVQPALCSSSGGIAP